MASPNDKGQGQFNLGAYSNPRVDDLTLKVQTETDQGRRNAMIREAFEVHAADVGHIPLHQQALAWAMKKDVEVVQLADNFMFFKWIRKGGDGAAAR
jgi:peptide/nickel transport system substrate-binding protein